MRNRRICQPSPTKLADLLRVAVRIRAYSQDQFVRGYEVDPRGEIGLVDGRI